MAARPAPLLARAAPTSPPAAPVVLVDSVSALDGGARGAIVVTGSHAGLSAARHAASFRPFAAILHDACGGKEGAGFAGLAILDAMGVRAATVDGRSARIGDARDVLDRGLVSHVNELARADGIRPGQAAAEAVARWRDLRLDEAGPVLAAEGRVVIADSISLLGPAHRGLVAVCGSHAAPSAVRMALGLGLAAAVHHDAGGGRDGHGLAGLADWQANGTPAATASHDSARIGDGRDVLASGILSAANDLAIQRGLTPGLTVAEAVERLLAP